MAVELLVARLWEFDGYLTTTRWPVRCPDRGYSDVDVVGSCAGGHVRLAECKVRYAAQAVLVVDADTAIEFETWMGTWRNCLDNVPRLVESAPAWLPARRDLSDLQFWFCANIWFADSTAHATAEAELTRMLRDKCPWGTKGKTVARIVSTREVLLEVIKRVRGDVVDDKWGRRYGDPLLDAVRELVRYSCPKALGGGRVGQEIARESARLLMEALCVAPENSS